MAALKLKTYFAAFAYFSAFSCFVYILIHFKSFTMESDLKFLKNNTFHSDPVRRSMGEIKTGNDVKNDTAFETVETNNNRTYDPVPVLSDISAEEEILKTFSSREAGLKVYEPRMVEHQNLSLNLLCAHYLQFIFNQTYDVTSGNTSMQVYSRSQNQAQTFFDATKNLSNKNCFLIITTEKCYQHANSA